MQTLEIPYSVEGGKNIIEEKSSARTIHMLRMGLIALQQTQLRFTVVDPKRLFEDRVLPDFGFQLGQYVWISSQCRQYYGAERILNGLSSRVIYEEAVRMSLNLLRQTNKLP